MFCFIIVDVQSQPLKTLNAAEIKLALKKLNVLGSVLYIAAHPDDENTRLITWLDNERLTRTAYLSLTRGDGGQNLIGPEKGSLLGVLRTQELLAARRIDGGEQFFSRAIDFGYSKHPDETFNIWDREKVLADVVWAIRKFKPDVIVTRFNTTPGITHGHHTASAMLAVEAFDAAADPKKFPGQQKYVEAWQPKRLYWNTSSWFFRGREDEFNEADYIKADIGEYSPLLGISFNEMAMKSRSQHRSQGFGALLDRGSQLEYLKYTKGSETEYDLLEGLDMTWNRVAGGEKVEALISKAIENYDEEVPHKILPVLVEAWREMNKLEPGYWLDFKKEELRKLLLSVAGVWYEATAFDFMATPGDSVEVTFNIISRASIPVRLKSIQFPNVSSEKPDELLKDNHFFTLNKKIKIADDAVISQPYWLRKPSTKGMFTVTDQQLTGLPENPPALKVNTEIELEGETFSYKVPVDYKWRDRAKGELHRPFEIRPKVMVNIPEKVYVFSDNSPQDIRLKLIAGTASEGTIRLDLPQGWKSDQQEMTFKFDYKKEEQDFVFSVTPPAGQSVGTLKGIVTVDGIESSYSLVTINYDHIPAQSVFPPAEARIVRLDIKKSGQNIGYIMGAGDEVPSNIRQMGYEVTLLEKEHFETDQLSQFDAIVVGIRAYNIEGILTTGNHKEKLMQYVENGGTVVTQYNTSYSLKDEQIGPYPFEISRDRVTVEEAPVTFIDPGHTLLNTPNKITKEDFESWVQERGLYFAGEWDEKYEPLLRWNDPGEDPVDGSLLVTKYGKGAFIYTGISFFRQLPAGVAGAFRLFANILSYGSDEQ